MSRDIVSNHFTTSDGVRLHYLESGSGDDTIIMIPGGGFTAQSFKYQIEALGKKYHVLSIDKRGHGKSKNINHGYRISRFAKDLHDLIESLQLKNIILLCHSLGVSVALNYYDLFGFEKVKKLIWIDEPVTLLINPKWTEKQKKAYGAIYEPSSLHNLTNSFVDGDKDVLNNQIVDSMTTPYVSNEIKQFILSCMDIPGNAAANLYFNNICQDWRDIVPNIKIPILLITGRGSLHPWESHEWIHKQIPSSKLYIFEENEGGNHFMFIENPELFNHVVTLFLQEN